MKEQNFLNHKKYDKGFHGVTFTLLMIILVCSIFNLYNSIRLSNDVMSGIIFFLISLILISYFFYMRIFALKAQDRAIRAEENLRHYVLSGKLIDPALTMSQITALRFAPDDEFIELSNKTSADNLKSSDIKKAIKKWKADHNRV